MTRRIFAILNTLLLVFLLVTSLSVLNIKLASGQPEKIKQFMETSGVDTLVAFYIKDSMAQQNQFNIAEGKNLETLDKAINRDTIKPFIDQSIARVLQLVDNHSPENLDFDLRLTLSTTDFPIQNTFVKHVKLSDNNYFLWLMKSFDLLYFLLGLSVLLIASLLFLAGKNWTTRLLRKGMIFIIVGCVFGLLAILSWKFAPYLFSHIISRFAIANDPRLITGATKVLGYFSGQVAIFYLIESVIMIILGSILRYLGGGFVREDLGEIGKKI
jgi:hypothetical protein